MGAGAYGVDDERYVWHQDVIHRHVICLLSHMPYMAGGGVEVPAHATPANTRYDSHISCEIAADKGNTGISVHLCSVLRSNSGHTSAFSAYRHH